MTDLTRFTGGKFSPILAPFVYFAISTYIPSTDHHWVSLILAGLRVIRVLFLQVTYRHYFTTFVHPFHLPMMLNCPLSSFLGHSFVLVYSVFIIVFDIISIIYCCCRDIRNKDKGPSTRLVCVTKLILKKKELFNFYNVYLGTKRNNRRKQKKEKQNKFKKGKTMVFF